MLDGSDVQLRLTNNYNNKIFTDFYTYTDGNLLINPQNNGNAKNAGIGLTTSTLPTEMLDVAGDARIRTIPSGTPVTNDFLIYGEKSGAANNGKLHGLLFTGSATQELCGDGNWRTRLSACSGSGGTANQIAKFTAGFDICNSTIWENSTSDFNVGIHTTTPRYKFHSIETGMFSHAALSSAITQYVVRPYPLAVESYNTGTTAGYTGFSVFGGSGSSHKDELNIFVDDNNITCFTNRGNLTNFYYEPTNPAYANVSMLGFNPAGSSTLIMDDFSISHYTAPTPFTNTRFYVESQDHGNTIVAYAGWINNKSNDNVTSNASSYGLKAESDNEHDQVNMSNIGADCIGGNASSLNIGIVATANNTCANCSTATSIAGRFNASGPHNNIGTQITIQNNTSTGKNHTGADITVANNGDNAVQTGSNVYIWSYGNSSENIGYKAIINDNNATTNQGGYFDVWQAGTSTTEGIFARIPAVSCTSSCTQFAGHFSGPVLVQSTPIFSDSALKQNIQPIQKPLSLLDSINPKTYEFNKNAIPQLWLPDGTHYGLIAQDVESVFPQFVSNATEPALKDTAGNIIYPAKNFKALNYNEFIPILIASVKSQQVLIDTLTSQLSSLQTLVNGCCGAARPGQSENGHSETITLKNITTIILDQNVPNPFKDQTDIRYSLTDDVKSATMLFYDNSGHVLQTVDLKERGQGVIHIYAPDLSSGIYTYSLIADGKVIETKRMVKSK